MIPRLAIHGNKDNQLFFEIFPSKTEIKSTSIHAYSYNKMVSSDFKIKVNSILLSAEKIKELAKNNN